MKKALRVRFSGIKDIDLPDKITQDEIDAKLGVITEEVKSEMFELDGYLVKVNEVELITRNSEQ